MSWYIKLHSIKKFEVSKWQKIFVPNSMYLLVIEYFDDDPYYSDGVPERRMFFVENITDAINDISLFLKNHSPVTNIGILNDSNFFTSEQLEYIELSLK